MALSLPDPQLPGNPQDALQSIQRNFEALSQTLAPPIPTGTILPYAAGSAPLGYLVCNGLAIPRADYPALFEVIQYTYGGSGASFALPDLQGRVPTGRDGGVFSSLGGTGGEANVTLGLSHIPPHAHGVGTLANSSVADHKHGPGTLKTDTIGNHDHGAGGLTTNTVGGHTHSTFGKTNDTTSTGGSGTRVTELTGSAQGTTGTTNSGGSHDHNVIGSTGLGGTHSHDLTSGLSADGGGHNHTISGSTADSGGSGSPATTQAHSNLAPYIIVTYIIKA